MKRFQGELDDVRNNVVRQQFKENRDLVNKVCTQLYGTNYPLLLMRELSSPQPKHMEVFLYW